MSRSSDFSQGASEHRWVHDAEWFHGTSVPGLSEIDASKAPSRYPSMDRGYAMRAHNFATTDYELAARYAEEAADADGQKGVAGRRPVVYRVRPTSDYFDPDPHSGPYGWNDGPGSLSEAQELHDNGIPVSMRFHDRMEVLKEHPVGRQQP